MFEMISSCPQQAQHLSTNATAFSEKLKYCTTPVARAAFGRIASAVLFALLLSVPALAQSTAASAVLSRHTAPQILEGSAVRVSHYNSEQKLRLVLAIRPPHMAEEEQFLTELQTKGSPNFHQFLTADEWNARFAPSAEDEQKVVDWAARQGLTVTNRYSHRLIVDLEGTAGTIERAFGVTINNYRVGDEVDFANDRDPVLPPSIAGIVYSVQGLNNIQRDSGASIGAEKVKGEDYLPGPVVGEEKSDQKDGDPTQLPDNLLENDSPVGNITGNEMDPSDLYSSNTYNYNGLKPLAHCCNVHNDSTGSPNVSSIAIAGFGNFLGSDITGFHNQYPFLAYNWTAYNIDGTPGCSKSTINPPCATGETTEDIEWTIATSNSFGSSNDTAHVYIYLGGNGNLGTYTDIYSQILSDNKTRVMTTSWSCTEIYGCDKPTMDSRHSIFNSMVGQGWTLIAASGDRGASDDCNSAHIAVAYPGSDPDVIAAGGTQLSIYSNGTWKAEQGWTGGTYAKACSRDNNGGSGGGVSSYYNQPSWQSKLSKLGSKRLTPDLSLNAAGIGQNLYINGVLNGDANGTSVVAPELAGFFAQENTYLNYIGHICGSSGTSVCTPIGNPLPFIYTAGLTNDNAHNPFYDITTGCNSNDVTTAGNLPFYCAKAGYDQVTGWGTANMMQLAWALNWQLIPANGVPFVQFSGPVTNKWYNNGQVVKWTIVDYQPTGGKPGTGIAGFTQGWDSIPADPSTEPHGGTGNSFYSGPQFADTNSGCLSLVSGGGGCSGGVSQGCHTVHVRGWNNQGQTTGDATYGSLCYDTVSPVTTISHTGTPKPDGWYATAVTVTLSATDPLAQGAAAGSASGVAHIFYSVDNSACTPQATGNCQVYGSPFSISTTGAHTVRSFSEDNAGNFSAGKSLTLDVDVTAPVTTATQSPAADRYGWNNSTVNVTLSANDNGGPGISKTYYSVDNSGCVAANTSACSSYGTPISITTPGRHTVFYFSVDNVGNVEAEQSHSVYIDEAAPVTTASLSGTKSGSGYTGTVTVTLAATDKLSGVASAEYDVNGGGVVAYTGPFKVTLHGNVTIAFRSVDKAGNAEAVKSIKFTTPPVVPTLASPGNGVILPTGTTSTVLKWDAVSGATSYTAQVHTGSCTGTAFGSGYSGPNTSFTLSGLTNGTTYYWRVLAKDGAGSSAYSNCFSFKN